MRTKPSSQLTLHDKLSRLSPERARKVLGPEAGALLPKGASIEIDVEKQLLFTEEVFQVTFPHPAGEKEPVVVSLALHPSYRDRLQIVCSHLGEVGALYKAATKAMELG